ncbi:MAG TPA: SPFH domain-containing protein [Leptospiraceae bacterium]|nr:SPFH domain-containing protein [Leptospiraceae bacterium]HMY65796.1 SPFH domain-containing protein [Leptospiraceae bacterium]HNF26317.1 SPFH domain-containing protein [Leptospiraceae bacterium]HNI95293.1 SPFH domain-containing protein [Leptospiraceae bacterium]HNM01483.1 SPFH domain-containing protein [Leptospiraceae bacterium]
MKSILKYSFIGGAIFSIIGCTRIETGEVGLRIGFDKQVKNEELLPGSFNQTIIGSVMTFPVKEVAVKIDDLTPLAKDNSTMKDFDATIIYNINQTQVAEIYNSKNKSFHETHDGDTYLMYNYIFNSARNAIYKSARKYEALDMADNRAVMEQEIKETIIKTLADEKLDGTITISQVLIRNITPADSIVASANELVKAKNELKTEEIKVATAKKRNESMQANPTMIPLMKAEAEAQYLRELPAAIANFKGQTLIIGGGASPVVPVGGK